jgi:phosphoserine aminotransferase
MQLNLFGMPIHNFNAGPSHLPAAVVEEAAEAVRDFQRSGLSLLEISHRGSYFLPVIEEARALARELMELEEDFEVLFLHGGGRTQFMQAAMNLLDQDREAAYVDTGTWASKAIEEAQLFGNVRVIASSADKNYSYIPKEFAIPEQAAYLHLTTNNTIYGTQWHHIPDSPVPLVADMSSDILSHAIDFNRFGLIYAGAQKNIGAAGVTLVAVRKSILGKIHRAIPSMMDYRVHIKNASIYNTPPVFAIYTCLLVLRWLKAQGGVNAIEQVNNRKAALLYREIDENPLFTGTAAVEDRSRMNVCFVMNDKVLEKEFAEFCTKEGMYGIKGHRSVGGFRVSLYNAVTEESTQAMVDAMKHFSGVKA